MKLLNKQSTTHTEPQAAKKPEAKHRGKQHGLARKTGTRAGVDDGSMYGGDRLGDCELGLC